MSNLLPGENLVLKAHPHWIVLVKSVWIPVVWVVLVLFLDFTFLKENYNSWNLPTHFRTFLTLAAIALAGPWMIVVWSRWQPAPNTPTDHRRNVENRVCRR